jgi:hypothetical protein
MNLLQRRLFWALDFSRYQPPARYGLSVDNLVMESHRLLTRAAQNRLRSRDREGAGGNVVS